jgi:hypothetical protein
MHIIAIWNTEGRNCLNACNKNWLKEPAKEVSEAKWDINYIHMGSWPESLVARGQARLFGVAGSNPPGSVSTLLSDSSVSVSLIHAYGGITPCVQFFYYKHLYTTRRKLRTWQAANS